MEWCRAGAAAVRGLCGQAAPGHGRAWTAGDWGAAGEGEERRSPGRGLLRPDGNGDRPGACGERPGGRHEHPWRARHVGPGGRTGHRCAPVALGGTPMPERPSVERHAGVPVRSGNAQAQAQAQAVPVPVPAPVPMPVPVPVPERMSVADGERTVGNGPSHTGAVSHRRERGQRRTWRSVERRCSGIRSGTGLRVRDPASSLGVGPEGDGGGQRAAVSRRGRRSARPPAHRRRRRAAPGRPVRRSRSPGRCRRSGPASCRSTPGTCSSRSSSP